MQCILIAPTMSQPRFHKRCQQLIDAGCVVNVFAFERSYYNFNSFPKKASVISLGPLSDGRYIKRVLHLIKAYMIIRKSIGRDRNQILYAFSYDCFFLGKLLRLRKSIFEIGDLRISKLSQILWKIVYRLTDKVVLTSEGFSQNLEKGLVLEKNKFHFIENKLDKKLIDDNRENFLEQEIGKRIVIGVIGFLRYEKPLRLLVNFVEKYSDKFEIRCFGDGPYKELFKDSNLENISYFGPYKGSQDLDRIYKQVDLNFVVYDNESENVRLALPNKLYESIYFLKPILCSENTFLETQVVKRNVGTSLSLNSYSDFSKGLLAISNSMIKKWKEEAFAISKEDLIDHGEREVVKILNSIKRV